MKKILGLLLLVLFLCGLVAAPADACGVVVASHRAVVVAPSFGFVPTFGLALPVTPTVAVQSVAVAQPAVAVQAAPVVVAPPVVAAPVVQTFAFTPTFASVFATPVVVSNPFAVAVGIHRAFIGRRGVAVIGPRGAIRIRR